MINEKQIRILLSDCNIAHVDLLINKMKGIKLTSSLDCLAKKGQFYEYKTTWQSLKKLEALFYKRLALVSAYNNATNQG